MCYARWMIGVLLDLTRPPGELTFVLMWPVLVGVKTIVISSPRVACSSHRKASVFGAQIARVLGRRSRIPTLCLARFLHP